MFRSYDRILNRRPILTQALSTGALFVIGDIIAQQGVEKKGFEKHDIVRTARLAAFGSFVAGPSVAMWYPFLQKSVTFKAPIAALTARVFLDQMLFAPTFIAIFFSFNGLMEGKNVDQVKDKLQKGYMAALYNNWKLWPAVQFANFALVPVLYRSLVVNTVATGWNTYLSVANAEIEKGTSELVLV
ncbi:hypothetical protein BC829DRAFT_375608 [Chytridium lagenaria]|nr:hypothetical protein BC829DRAFT_375608 [Chytridium lagenaria]